MSKIDANDVARDKGLDGLTEELDGKTAAAADSNTTAPVQDADWPAPLAQAAYIGLAGRVVRSIAPHTEADDVALIIQFLAAYGNCIGRGCHWRAGADEHHGNLFMVLVGRSARGRKGSAWGEIRRLFEGIGDGWQDRIQSGASSSEGIIWAVRNEIIGRDKKGAEVTLDGGVADKRLLIQEPEFANVLKQAERNGNTLSAVLRQAWERGDLQTLTKNAPARATGAHISIIGHITKDELLRHLGQTETANGFANRFIWVCCKRSKLLPHGGALPDTELAGLRQAVQSAVNHGRRGMLLERELAVAAMWEAAYANLTADRDGLAAAVCNRAEAQVMRLAMLYALLDGRNAIGAEHLTAGLAVWDYCEQSAGYVFGRSLGDPTADRIDEALRCCDGLTRVDISALFGRHATAAEIDRALNVLQRTGRARRQTVQTGGRPIERWISTLQGMA